MAVCLFWGHPLRRVPLETAGNKVDENGIAALQNGRQILGSGTSFPAFTVGYATRITLGI